MILTEKQKEIIEKVGVALECRGHRPAEARILGLLYVADRTELSFEEITEALSLSKSAISNALSFLQQGQQLEYITHSGERKRYFRIKFANWQEGVLQQVEDVTCFSRLLREVLEIRTDTTPDFNARLMELSSFLEFVSARLPGLMEEWKKEKFFRTCGSSNYEQSINRRN